MGNLFIEGTDQTLEVNFKIDGKLRLQGISTPDHVNHFFDPLFQWIKDFEKTQPKTIEIELFIDYLNTSSTRILVEFLSLLNDIREKGVEVKALWKYEDDDEDMFEFGEELALTSGLPLEYKGVEVDY